MRRFRLMLLSAAAGGGMLLFGGCVTSAQFNDFVRTEFARVTSDLFGQFVSVFIQSASPFAVQ